MRVLQIDALRLFLKENSIHVRMKNVHFFFTRNLPRFTFKHTQTFFLYPLDPGLRLTGSQQSLSTGKGRVIVDKLQAHCRATLKQTNNTLYPHSHLWTINQSIN